MRNTCLRRAAAEMGLPLPGDDDLSALGSDVTLARAMELWKTATAGPGADAVVPTRASRGLALKAAWVTMIALLSLALTYGRLH